MKERKGIPEREGTETESPKMARQGEKKEDSGRLERGHERGQSWRMVKDLMVPALVLGSKASRKVKRYKLDFFLEI